MCDNDHDKENKLPLDMINTESHCNFVKIHLLSHLCDHIHHFGNIPMYSAEIGELAHKTQIQQVWRQSNKHDAARQILHSYGQQHAIQMRLMNLESLQDRAKGLSADDVKHFDRTSSTVSQPVICRRILELGRDDMSKVDDFSRMSRVSLNIIYPELIRYNRHYEPMDHRLPEHHAILRSLPVELLTQLTIPPLAFPKLMFTRPSMHDPLGPYTLDTRGVAMIGIGYKRVQKKCMVR